jgi:hypothetical protein
MSAAILMLANPAMSSWHELANSRKSSFVAFFVQYDLLPRPGIFPGRAGRPARPGASYARPGCFIELLRGHPDLRKPAIERKARQSRHDLVVHVDRFARRRANHLYKLAPSLPTEGRHAIVTVAGRDAVDADALLTNGAEADGEVVWS